MAPTPKAIPKATPRARAISRTMTVHCGSCDVTVEAQIVGNYSTTPDGGLALQYSFAMCPSCKFPILTSQEADLLDGEWDPPVTIFPAPSNRLSAHLPKPIQQAYNEAEQCLRAKAFTASAIMCRKTLEGICVTRGISERNLATSLKRLKDNKLIDERLFEWAEALRVFGNEAAHDVNVTIAPQDAKDILDFTLALIEYIFTFQERFEAFRNRRPKKKGA